jgi:tubulin polyglutamylase TTLL6/13
MAGHLFQLKHKKAENAVYINYENCKYPILRVVSNALGWKSWTGTDRVADWDVYWTDSGRDISRWVRAAKAFQRVNHFPGMVHIYRKGHLARVMAGMQVVSAREYDFFPETWLLPGDYGLVQAHFAKHPGAVVIVKPR